MSDALTIEAEALGTITQLLDILNIQLVVSVDDENGDGYSIEDFFSAILDLPTETICEICPELRDNLPDDKEILRERLRRHWDSRDENDRPAMVEQAVAAKRLQNSDGVDDPADAAVMKQIIPSDKLLMLTPDQWEEQKNEILERSTTDNLLLLFDQDLSKASGGDPEGGMKIISSITSDAQYEKTLCGLITHTVQPNQLPDRWLALAEENSVPSERFLVLPKKHLHEDPLQFAQVLKWTALIHDFSELKSRTNSILAEATTHATSEMDNVNIYDLDHIVLNTSAIEGLWEPEMVLRLHSMFHRKKSLSQAYADPELESISKRLRSVSHIPSRTKTAPVSRAWELQRMEFYEDAEYLNANHLPLDLGDIFEKTGAGSSKKYILLAQPCDVRLRRNGKREPEQSHFPLVEVVLNPKNRYQSEELEYWGSDLSEAWYVKLKRRHQVCASVLDLCVLSGNGIAMLIEGDDPPDGVRPELDNRYKALQVEFIRGVFRYADMLIQVNGEPIETCEQKKALMTALLRERLFKGSISVTEGKKRIEYNVKRVGRLTRSRAYPLLLAFTSSMGRPATDRTFGHIDEGGE